MLEQPLTKADAPDEKVSSIKDNLNRHISDIKASIENHKIQNKHEIDTNKNALSDIKQSQDLILGKLKDQNINSADTT